MPGEDSNASISEGNGDRMKREIKNTAASVRARLFNLSKATNRNFDAVLLQYLQERLLYRLSISPYKLNFILKGALLFLVYGVPVSRPTKDIDFLGVDISNTKKNLLQIMKEVVSIIVEDGVRFDSESLDSEIIKEDADYQGIRIYCKAFLGQAYRRFHFDIGFGDIVVPNPVSLNFPVLLLDMPIPELIAYTPESAIAEKFEAIVKLGFTTSRMKDFYDIYHMANHRNFHSTTLKEAIHTTFNNRKTTLSNRTVIYSDEFINDPTKNKQWKAFLRRMDSDIDLSFHDCINCIKTFIEPLFEDNNNKIGNKDKLGWINGGINV